MATLIKCLALETFTRFVPDFGQVHGDPGSTDERAREPMVPEHVVDALLAEGKIAVEEHDAPAKPAKGARKAASAADDDAPPV